MSARKVQVESLRKKNRNDEAQFTQVRPIPTPPRLLAEKKTPHQPTVPCFAWTLLDIHRPSQHTRCCVSFCEDTLLIAHSLRRLQDRDAALKAGLSGKESWDKVCSYVDLASDPKRKANVSRMKGIMIAVKATPPTLIKNFLK